MSAPGGPVHLRLYVTGRDSRSQRAIERLERVCAGIPECRLQVIDTLDDPRLATDERILLTPTVIREQPAPSLRLTGDLSDPVGLVEALGLTEWGAWHQQQA